VKVTGALLAEAASVVGGKLNVVGGVVHRFRTGPDRVVNLTLVVLAQFDTSESGPKLTVELITPSGDSQSERLEMPPVSLGTEVGFACWPLWVPAETDGRYVFVVSGDEGSVSLPLTVYSDPP
jgi:hypothetical protein